MSTILDDAAFGGIGDRLCGVEAVLAEGNAATPSEHWHSQRALDQLRGLCGHLRNVPGVVQARAEAARLPHLHDVLLHFTFWHCLGYRRNRGKSAVGTAP